MAPEDRGLLFIVTLIVAVLLINEVAEQIQFLKTEVTTEKDESGNLVQTSAENEFGLILSNLVTELARLISSLLSAALGRYITDLMGKTIVEQPGYALGLTAVIISMLYLAKRSLFRKRKAD